MTYEGFRWAYFDHLTTAFAYRYCTAAHPCYSQRMSDYERAGENIVKHANGTYYLRAKVLGKVVKKSLKTKELRIAKIKRDDLLGKERSAATARKPGLVRTIRDALAILRGELVDRPHVRPRTREFSEDVIRIMTDSLPLDAHGRTWSKPEASAWWSKIAKKYSPSVANKVLSAGKKLAGILIREGLRHDDPTADLRRMPSRKILRKVPSREQMGQIIAHIRTKQKRECMQSSRLVAFMAFSGTRKGEASRFELKHAGEDMLAIGEDGDTKSGKFRLVPISEPLRAILDDLSEEGGTGPVFTLASPRRALKTACKAVGCDPMRIHDLRHFFATWCIQSGIDIPTVAKWLGHSDGGALAMRTYGHVRDDHGLEAVKKLA